jgi:phosphoglucosamine mutase
MSAPRLFGTDGIRGRALEGALSTASVARIGRALARFAREKSGTSEPLVVVGRDTRSSGPALRDSVIAGLVAEGARVESLGVIPTPGVAWYGDHLKAAMSVVVSASHNPPEDNGIKVFLPGARKLSDDEERAVEAEVERLADAPEPARTTLPEMSTSQELDVVTSRGTTRKLRRNRYGVELVGAFTQEVLNRRVVVDPGFGATALLATEVLADCFALVTALNDEHDGARIGLGSGAVHPDVVARETLEKQADLGIAFDGDGDRVILADEKGVVRDGDDVLYVLARSLARAEQLPERTIVGTPMTNGGLDAALAKDGIRVVRTEAVGDRSISELLRARGWALGGEPSGHVIIRSWQLTGDGVFTALSVLREMAETKKTLAELCAGFVRFPQVNATEPAPMKPPFEKMGSFHAILERKRGELAAAGGRLVVRYSGTEPILRLMAEGPPSLDLEGAVRELRETFRRELGSAR